MEETCPKCGASVKPTDYFCFNCGNKFRDPPPSTTAVTQALYYIGSLVLPPMGFFWSIKYLKQADDTSKRIGIIMIALTILSIVVSLFATAKIFDMMNSFIGSYTGL